MNKNRIGFTPAHAALHEVAHPAWLNGISAFSALVLFCGLAACSRPPELIGVDNAEMPVAVSKDVTLHKVFIATTRQTSEEPGVFLSADRSGNLGLASAVVSIPPTHVAGELERPKRLPPDPEREFAIVDPEIYGGGNSFVSAINAELAKRAPKDRDVLLFVHGYNNTASDSVLRIAQFVEDTGYSGVAVLFSWASAAKTSHYVYDLNSALVARPMFLRTGDLLERTNARGFHVFAHSMGSLLTIESIVQAELAGDYGKSGRLDSVMLAAPDIDLDLFKTQLAHLSARERNFIVFASKDDKALSFSKRISGGIVRVGAADAQTLDSLGVSVIDLSEIDDSASGSHSKFAGSPEIVQLIGNGLKADFYQDKQRQPVLVESFGGVPVLTQQFD
jgi:esterase/lipase superfamily enzyme